MDPAEVLAIEVRQHVGQGLKALAPMLIGQTAAAQRAKSGRSEAQPEVGRDLLLRRFAGEGTGCRPCSRKILDWSKSRVPRIDWGEGKQDGSFVPVLHHKGIDYPLFAVYTYGKFETHFQHYLNRPPFTSGPLRVEKLNRLNAIPGVSLPQDSITKRPSIPLKSLLEEGRTEALLSVYEWVLEQIRTV